MIPKSMKNEFIGRHQPLSESTPSQVFQHSDRLTNRGLKPKQQDPSQELWVAHQFIQFGFPQTQALQAATREINLHARNVGNSLAKASSIDGPKPDLKDLICLGQKVKVVKRLHPHQLLLTMLLVLCLLTQRAQEEPLKKRNFYSKQGSQGLLEDIYFHLN